MRRREAARKPRVLVTGGTGLIGREVVRSLVRDGDAFPVVIGRGKAPGTAEILARAQLGQLSFVKCSLSENFAEAVALAGGDGFDHVVHCAGHYRLPPDPLLARQANIEGTARIAEICHLQEIRSLTYISTILVTGAREGAVAEAPVRDPGNFRNLYEATKWEAERRLIDLEGTSVRIFRPGATLGNSVTGETTKFDGPYSAFRLVRSWLPLPVPKVATPVFPLVNSDLVADAVAASVRNPPTGLEIYHAIDLECPSLVEFSRSIAERLGDPDKVREVPEAAFRALINLPGFSLVSGASRDSAQYLYAPARYETSGFAAYCAANGIRGARLSRSYDPVTEYYARHCRRGGFGARSP